MTLAPLSEPWSVCRNQFTRCDQPTSLCNQGSGGLRKAKACQRTISALLPWDTSSALCSRGRKLNYCCPNPETTVSASVSTSSSPLPPLVTTKLECSVWFSTMMAIVPVQFEATVYVPEADCPVKIAPSRLPDSTPLTLPFPSNVNTPSKATEPTPRNIPLA